jgi:hypothetical protein
MLPAQLVDNILIIVIVYVVVRIVFFFIKIVHNKAAYFYST